MNDREIDSAMDQRTILLRMREDARLLYSTADDLVQPQYRYLLARIDALIEIGCHEHPEPAEIDPRGVGAGGKDD